MIVPGKPKTLSGHNYYFAFVYLFYTRSSYNKLNICTLYITVNYRPSYMSLKIAEKALLLQYNS